MLLGQNRFFTGGGAAGAMLLLLAALASLPALGQEGVDASRFYAGVGVAGVDAEDRYQGVTYGGESFGWHIYGGYRIIDRVAVEVGYKSMGEIAVGDLAGSGIKRLDISADLEVAVVRATLSLPLSEMFRWHREVSIFGSAGLHSSSLRRKAVERGSMLTDSDSIKDSGLAFGGGVLYRMGPVDLRGYAEWLDVNKMEHARAVGVAVQFRFSSSGGGY